MAKIELTDSQGNTFSLEVTDGEMFLDYLSLQRREKLSLTNIILECTGMQAHPDGEFEVSLQH